LSGSEPHLWATIGNTNTNTNTGEVPEWLNGLVSKTSVSFGHRGFKSLPLRHSCGGAFNNEQVGEVSERLNEHAWKACVSATAPGVRIPPSPPFSRPPWGRRVASRRASEPGGGSGPMRWVGFEPGQAGNGAALRASIQARGARALRRARCILPEASVCVLGIARRGLPS
jgi:hypothetical protein